VKETNGDGTRLNEKLGRIAELKLLPPPKKKTEAGGGALRADS
jgi:hypothetical protein